MVSAVYQLSRSPKKPLALWLCRESAPFPPERHTTSPRGASPQRGHARAISASEAEATNT